VVVVSTAVAVLLVACQKTSFVLNFLAQSLKAVGMWQVSAL